MVSACGVMISDATVRMVRDPETSVEAKGFTL